jgi:hypothetical protein
LTRQRLNAREAAEALGISVDAVRMRVRRGTLEAERDANGRLHVWVDTDDPQPDSRALISQLRDEIAYLREESRRKDHIIAGLVERLPTQLEAPASPEPREASTVTTEGVSGTGGPPERETPSERPEGHDRVPWWRRVFGR